MRRTFKRPHPPVNILHASKVTLNGTPIEADAAVIMRTINSDGSTKSIDITRITPDDEAPLVKTVVYTKS